MRSVDVKRAGAAALGVLAMACTPRYREPKLPEQQVAVVTVEERAVVTTVNGAEPFDKVAGPARKFKVAPGCHELHVEYEQDYFRVRESRAILVWTPRLPVTAGVTALFAAVDFASNVTVANYETDEPIRFHVPAKAGMGYWVTSTFTGDVFVPRVAVLNAANERVAVILPNQPCEVMGGKDVPPVPKAPESSNGSR